jgi:hypothetical protein
MDTILSIWRDSTPLLLASLGALRFWYAVPLITSVSLVCAATRHEDMQAILIHAARFALWILVFMGVVLVGLQFLGWLQ